MRIIAGTAKGIRLGPVPRGARPLSDRAREGLFSSLGSSVLDARCADLFAGTGAVGMEALSRGAASCLFVDSAPAAIRAIEDNLDRTHLTDRARVARSEAGEALRLSRARFDLIFLDPPYAMGGPDLGEVLEGASARLASGGIAVLTRDKRNHADVVPIDWSVVRLLAYGDARILICREAT